MARTKTTTTNTDNGSTAEASDAEKPRSEQRQRDQVIGVRIGEAEADLLAHARRRAAFLGAVLPESAGGFLRWLAMNSASELVGETVVPTRKPPAAQRAPSIDNVAVARLMGEVGRLGNNVNQIAKGMHQTGDLPSVEAAIEMTAAINRLSLTVAALGGVRVDGSDEEEAEAFFEPPSPPPTRTKKTATTPAASTAPAAPTAPPGTAWTKSVSGWRAGATKTGGAS